MTTPTDDGVPTGAPPSTSSGPDPRNPYVSYAGASYGAPGHGPGSDLQQPGGPDVAAPSSTARVIGWVGVGLLYVLVVVQLVIPTVSTFRWSTTRGRLFGDAESVGLANWSDVVPAFTSTLGVSLMSAAPAVLVSMVLGAVIGTAMPAFSRLAVPVRIGVGLLAAMFVPLGVGLSRIAATDPSATGSPSPLADPSSAVALLVVTTTLAWLPLLTAIFATAFGAAFASGRAGRTAPLIGVVGLLAIVPLALQQLELPRALTGGGPAGAPETPMTLLLQRGFMNGDPGRGAAIGVIVIVVSGVLGLLAVAAVIGSRSRLTLEPGGSSSSGVVGLVAAGLVLVLAVVTLLPVLTGSSGGDLVENPTRAVLNTWAPTALGTAMQVVVAIAGGAAIGWCQPLGRRSPALLLPLAPWLFLGPGPSAIASFTAAQDAGSLDTWGALVPGPSVVVGAVLVMALLFSGVRERTSQLPVGAIAAAAAGLASVLLMVQAQSMLPSYLVASSPELWGAPTTVLATAGNFEVPDPLPLGLLAPLPMLFLVALLAVLGQLGTRRVTLVRD